MTVFDGQVAVVTGCARYAGIGRAVALLLAEQGAAVAVTDVSIGGTRNAGEDGATELERKWDGITSLVHELEENGVRAHGVVGDVSVSSDVNRMINEILEHFGRIDILVNNAGAPQGADRNLSWEIPEKSFELQWTVNTKGTFLMSTAVVRHLLGVGQPGRIVNISSDAGKYGPPRRSAYASSKFAIVGLTQSMAREVAEYGITVNAVCPGAIDSPRTAATKSRNESTTVSAFASTTPVGRIGLPKDIARTVAFLADPAASYITGQAICVNGGMHMY